MKQFILGKVTKDLIVAKSNIHLFLLFLLLNDI